MTVTLTDQDNGSTVQARPGDTIELRLSENATTGYRWQMEMPNSHFAIEALEGDYVKGRPGSAGVALFRIKVLSTGTQTLRLKYCRPWEEEAAVLSHFSVMVNGD